MRRERGIIDYAHHPLRSDFLDVYLSARCKFFIGSASGLAQVATAFGVRCAVANQVPLSVVYHHGPHDISIPKLFFSRKHNRYLTFEDLLTSATGNARFTPHYHDEQIDVLENEAQDITDLVSPAHYLFEAVTEHLLAVRTIGIGDGGNEIGMGKIPWSVIRRNIPRGGLIATLRRAARFVPFHRLYHSVELTLIAFAAAVIGLVAGQPLVDRIVVLALLPLAALALVGHFVAIMASRRVRA